MRTLRLIDLSLVLRKLVFHFLSNLMGYDRGDSFPFDFEPDGISFDSRSKGKPSSRSYPIQCESKRGNIVFSVQYRMYGGHFTEQF